MREREIEQARAIVDHRRAVVGERREQTLQPRGAQQQHEQQRERGRAGDVRGK